MSSNYFAWHRPNVNTRSSNYTTRVQLTRTFTSRRKIFRFCVTTALSEVFLESQMVFVFYRCFRPITQKTVYNVCVSSNLTGVDSFLLFLLVVISTGESNPDLSSSKVHQGRYWYEYFIYFLILMYSFRKY